jgi:DNA-binding beta-propeller fold protein YncE
VSVIDRVADTVRSTITVSDGPTNAITDPAGKVWVVCRGNAFGVPPTPGKVFIIDPTTLLKEDSVEFAQNLQGIVALDTSGYVYTVGAAGFFGGPVHRISLSTRQVEMNFIQDTSYAMAVDQVSRDIYVADARQFVEDGVASVYTSTGALRKRFSVQLGPGVVAFRHP